MPEPACTFVEGKGGQFYRTGVVATTAIHGSNKLLLLFIKGNSLSPTIQNVWILLQGIICPGILSFTLIGNHRYTRKQNI